MLHIIQNDPEVPPGNISDYLLREQILAVIHHPYLGDPLPEIRDVSGLIVLGGAMGACDDTLHPFLYDLKLFIRSLVTAGIPYLGICLGGQLLAAALGAAVVSRRWEERGTLSVSLTSDGMADPLFDGVAGVFDTFQWHHDSFDIPDQGVLLASSPACPHQAFRFGTAAWGVQFHPEVTEQIVRDWCVWDSMLAGDADALILEFRSREDAFAALSQRLLGNFISVAGIRSLSRPVLL